MTKLEEALEHQIKRMSREDFDVTPLQLAQRALALVLKHEWCAPTEHGNESGGRCPECEAPKDLLVGSLGGMVGQSQSHKPGCAWGAIVAAAKEIG